MTKRSSCDLRATADAVSTMAQRFAELASTAPQPDREVPATPGWSITDVLGHVATEPARYRELALGQGNWPSRVVDLPAFNAAQIRNLPTRDRKALAAKLLTDTASLISTITRFGADPPLMMFDGDQCVRADLALGTLLGEFVVHGHDIARMLHVAWRIDPAHVPIILDGTHEVMAGWVNSAKAGRHFATYELRLRGSTKHVYAFDNGDLTVDPPDRRKV
ncbi:MAG TPA: maleylpyruvate isomerase N-terminal domain-containing protein, partial [Mycobacterium sp.]|nr:maleylpyruvate isomerase N-terminal domain-containing protein [Mycobacterium sp.]